VGRSKLCDAALLGTVLTVPVHALAQDAGRFRFAWVRDESAEHCPDGPAIAREVARRLGRDPFAAADAPSIEASVRRDGPRWTARLVVRDATDASLGVREFTSDAADCAPIAAAITLGVALSIDPAAALRPPPPPTPPTPAPTPPAPRVVRPPETPWSRRAGVSLRALGAVGLLPSVAPGVALAAEGPIAGRLRWSVGLLYLPDSGLVTSRGSFAFGLVAAQLAPCLDLWRVPRASLTGCVGVELGALRSVVLRGDPSTVGERPWAAAFAGVRLRARLLGPLAGELGVEAVAPLVRDRFFEGGPTRETAFQQGVLAGVAFAGLGIQFP
jgi:hypothetical protein